MIDLTCYVDRDGDLIAIDTAERLRRATSGERRDSREEGTGTGAIRVSVAARTLRARAPKAARYYVESGRL